MKTEQGYAPSMRLGSLQAVNEFYFLAYSKILYDFQFGFRRNHKTTQPVLHFLDKIYHALSKDDPKYTISIFIDLKKPLIQYHIVFYYRKT